MKTYNIIGVPHNAPLYKDKDPSIVLVEGVSEDNKQEAIMLLLRHGAYGVRAELNLTGNEVS